MKQSPERIPVGGRPEDLNEGGSSKPCPSEPWRYVCPHCGSTAVEANLQPDNRRNDMPGGAFYCDAERRPLDTVYDKVAGYDVSEVR